MNRPREFVTIAVVRGRRVPLAVLCPSQEPQLNERGTTYHGGTLKIMVPGDACNVGGRTAFGDNLGHGAAGNRVGPACFRGVARLRRQNRKGGALDFVGRDNRRVG